MSSTLAPDVLAAARAMQAELHVDTADNAGAISDDELARSFTDAHADECRHVAALGRWYVWTGTHYRVDESMAVFDKARASCRRALGYALVAAPSEREKKALRASLGSAARVAAVVKLAGADRRHAVTVDQLDADPWLLNTPGGVLNLRDASLRPATPADLLTKITAAAPAPDAPIFRRTLERAVPDPEVRDYLQRVIGYLLTGVIREHVLVLVYGAGANGKSVLWNAIRHALGDYAITLGSEVLMESHNERHPTEIAVLRGARMALCSEVDSGRRWNESRIKRLTGGDPITARLIARDPFEFNPTHKIVLLANSKPGIARVDDAIRRRVHLVEFGVTVPENERDPELARKLQAEAGGILSWALEGCLDWQADGLRPPAAVIAATEQYLEREDTIAEWMRECCRPLGDSTITTLHRSYRDWAELNGMTPTGRNVFGDQLEAHGVVRVEVRPRVWVFRGISPTSREGVRHAG
jgi:putative DNA primase/helicase